MKRESLVLHLHSDTRGVDRSGGCQSSRRYGRMRLCSPALLSPCCLCGCLSDQSGILFALCCWLSSEKVGPPTAAHCFSLHPEQKWGPSLQPHSPVLCESSNDEQKQLFAAQQSVTDARDRLLTDCLLEGVPLGQYGLGALAKPWVNTKKQAAWYSFTWLLPLHPIPPPLLLPPFPFLASFTCVTLPFELH